MQRLCGVDGDGAVEGIFRRIFTAVFGLLFGVEAPGCQFMPRLVDINLPRDGRVQNNNNNTIWGGSVLTGEELPPHSGELKDALPQAGGPTQSQLSRPCRQDTTSPWSTDCGGNS